MIWLFILSVLLNYASAERYGLELGDLFIGPSASNHGVKGIVSVVNENTFYIRNFTYDGKAPAAQFWVGKTPQPSPNGILVPDELGTDQPLKEYQGRNIILSLPDNLKITDIKWFSIWCTAFNADFGHVMIPDGFDVPKPKELSSIPGRAHKVKSGRVILLDSKTIKINRLYYDGNGPDAFFLVGTEGSPNGNGIKVPDENGKLTRLHRYNGQDIILRLPDDYTWFDLKWFALYCIMARQNFGEVYISQPLHIPIDLSDLRQKEMTKPVLTNCREIFPDRLLVRWLVEGEDIYIELEGRANDNEYLSFGVSGSEVGPDMVGADVVVAFYSEPKYSIVVEDYHLTAKSQCAGGIGACPDVIQGGRSNVAVVHWRKENGIHSVIYKRRLEAAEAIDKNIYTNKSTSVVAAIGPMNSKMEAAKHTMVTRDLIIEIDFGKGAKTCESLKVETDPKLEVQPWPPFKISDHRTFNAQIGPTGTDRGYTPITGLVGWGIAWWINGLLIPEITVKRGLNYTFIVEGGEDPAFQANYHPLYITNNKEGGGAYENVGTPEHMVYAGLEIDESGKYFPVGVGRYCEYTHNAIDQSDNFEKFEDFKKTLTLKCEDGNPGMFTWTPDKDTPDLVYYQCYTHRNLGWKIHVQNENGAEHLLVFRNWILAFVMCNVAVILQNRICQA